MRSARHLSRLVVPAAFAVFVLLAIPAGAEQPALSAGGSFPTGGTTLQSGGRAAAGVFDGRIVFNSDDCQLWTVNPDGTALEQTTHFRKGCLAGAPEWSPDGMRIVFGLFIHDRVALYTIKGDGTDRRLVVDDGQGYFDVGPTYSPDGRSIVYSRCRPDPPGGCAIYRIAVDGTGKEALTSYARCGCNRSDSRPAVSPDGQQVAFSRRSHGVISRVFVMPASGGAARPVTPARVGAMAPSWTPDGSTLFYFGGPSHRGYGYKVFRQRLSGRDTRQLTFSPWPNGDLLADVSPSGKQVAFVSDRNFPDASKNQLFIMGARGEGQHLVLRMWANNPDWGVAPWRSGRSEQTRPTSAAMMAKAVRVQALVDSLEHTGTAEPLRPGATTPH